MITKNKLKFEQDDIKNKLEEVIQYQEKATSESLDKFAEATADSIQWVDEASNSLKKGKTAEECKALFKKECRKALDSKLEVQKSIKGIGFVFDHLSSFSEGQLCRKELEKAAKIMLSDGFAAIEDVIKNPLLLQKEQSKENANVLPVALSELLEISDKTINVIYTMGIQLMAENKHDEAISVFSFLNFLNPYIHEVWLCLGVCYHKEQNFLDAFSSYTMSSLMKPEDPLPYIFSAECFLSVNDKMHANASLQLAEYFLTSTTDDQYKNRIVELKKAM